MFVIKTIKNPLYKNCCHVHSNCGTAYIIKQNECKRSDVAQPVAMNSVENWARPSSYVRREGEVDLSRFFVDDEVENMIAYSNRVFGDCND